jgi:hypothetical protein
MATMTDEELAAWRSKRTGKAVSIDKSQGAGQGPDAARQARSPLDGYADPAPSGDEGDDDLSAHNKFDPTKLPGNDHGGADPELKNQLDAALGRVAPMQRQLEEMRAANEAAQRQMAELQAQLAEQNAAREAAARKAAADSFDPFEGFAKEEIEALDPLAADLIRKAARNAYTKAAGSVKDPEALINEALAKRDARTRDNFIRSTAGALNLVQLGNDPKFNKFLAEDDSAALLLNSFVQSPDVDTAKNLEPRVRAMLKRFEKSTTSTRTPDAQDRAAAHLDRAPTGTTQHGRKAATADEARLIRQEANRLTRARKFDEANKLLAQLS